MARIVLGLGTSHSPHVSTAPERWHLHAERDRRNPELDFAGLARRAPAALATQLTSEVFTEKHDACQRAIDRLGDALAERDVDAVVVVGDDQYELFRAECNPAFAVFIGDATIDVPVPAERLDPSIAQALWARHSAERTAYPSLPALGRAIAAGLAARDFDVAVAASQMPERGVGHAFTFVRLRLMKERLVPMIPVFINCYFAPNQPTPARCFAFGAALRAAIEAAPVDARVALVASGGLSHFVVDEALDAQVIAGIREKRADLLRTLPVEKLVSGSSEIRNWVAVAGALQDFRVTMLEYIPAYRSEAGTGCGMTFARWDP